MDNVVEAQDSCALALHLETVAHRYVDDMLNICDQEPC
jgi:hypothetical protein